MPTAWRVYECLIDTLMHAGATKERAIAFADDFFYSDESWDDLSVVNNHKPVIEKLVAALFDAELIGMD